MYATLCTQAPPHPALPVELALEDHGRRWAQWPDLYTNQVPIWRHLGWPWAHEAERRTWTFVSSISTRNTSSTSRVRSESVSRWHASWPTGRAEVQQRAKGAGVEGHTVGLERCLDRFGLALDCSQTSGAGGVRQLALWATGLTTMTCGVGPDCRRFVERCLLLSRAWTLVLAVANAAA